MAEEYTDQDLILVAKIVRSAPDGRGHDYPTARLVLKALATAGRLRPPKGIVKVCPFCNRDVGLHGRLFAYHLGRSGWPCRGGGLRPDDEAAEITEQNDPEVDDAR
jgi:hypothetical protein